MAESPPTSPPPPPTPRGDPPQILGSPEFSQIAPNSPQIRPRGRPSPARTRLRNRRYAALRELLRAGDYFSEDRMRLRAPALFHHYIGRFQRPQQPQNPPNSPQIQPGDPEIPKNPPKIPQNPPKIPGEPRELRELLLSALGSHDEEEEEEEEDEDDDDDGDEGRVPDSAEQELLRREFTTRMYQRFLEGQDGDFDYSQVDENPELDNLDLLSQDLEDRYFDEEEPGPAPPLL